MATVFVSYKREEQAHARIFADVLEASGTSVWWDPHLRAGERVDDAIEHAIRAAFAVVVLWSKRSAASEYVKTEASLALDLGKLIPVRIEQVDLPMRFRGLHTHSLTDWTHSPPSPDYQLILRDIEALRRRSDPSLPIAPTPELLEKQPQARSHMPPPNQGFVGTWAGEGILLTKGRAQTVLLDIRVVAEFFCDVVMTVTYERNGRSTTSNEVLSGVQLGGYSLYLKTLDLGTERECHFHLELTLDLRNLEGRVTSRQGEQRVQFTRQ